MQIPSGKQQLRASCVLDMGWGSGPPDSHSEGGRRPVREQSVASGTAASTGRMGLVHTVRRALGARAGGPLTGAHP